MDDGQPGTGRVRGYDWNADCVTGSAWSASSAYELDKTEKTCGLIFYTDQTIE